MSPQRRTALGSVVAACALIGLKLGTAISTSSLGLLSEAAHSGTDLVAAILTFVAVGVSGRPADPGHAYGHGKAEHLAALAEAGLLIVASLAIAWRALWRLTGLAHGPVDPKGYALVVVGAARVMRPRTLSRRRSTRRCRGATSSCTSSRAATRPSCASACLRRPSESRGCAKSTI